VRETKEKQYKVYLENLKKNGFSRLGLGASFGWEDDPIKLVISSSRYKFVSKILQGKKNVLEVGCGDAFYSRIVKQNVGSLTVCDFDKLFIEDFESRKEKTWKIQGLLHDMVKGSLPKKYDAVYSLDVLEHIKKTNEKKFITNCLKSLKKNGIFICGMPSIESQKYASKASKEGHVNCKSGPELKKTMDKYFENTFVFSMNDEVVHTGFYKMAHYLISISTGKKK
jgi:2-polyprenyl-3-methyl-5-hydroxy-6-metoxy-1,4-benzoquinol methylase